MSRRCRFERWWSRFAGSIAFVALILISGLGFARIENARYEGCQGGNLVRAGLRANEAANIRVIQATDPALFPNIPSALFKRLVDESVKRADYNIRVRFANRECGVQIDLPLAGAVITFPP